MNSSWWNPLRWLEAAWSVFASFFGTIFRMLGFGSNAGPIHEDIQTSDVDRAYNDAVAAENEVDDEREVDKRVRKFVRYIGLPADKRAEFDLSPFGEELQNFVLGMSEDDIEELRRRGPVGQIQAALIGRIPPGMEMKSAPEIASEPSKAQLVRDHFLRSVGRLREDRAEAIGSVDLAPALGL